MVIPDDEPLTNAELRQLLDKAMTRFSNWKVQMETNPNPRMVHSLKNILSIIESVAGMTSKSTEFSYKTLSRHMALLISRVAELNMVITSSLEKDDVIDSDEEEAIIGILMQVVQSASDLLRIVQERFGLQNKYAIDLNSALLPDLENSEDVLKTGKTMKKGKKKSVSRKR